MNATMMAKSVATYTCSAGIRSHERTSQSELAKRLSTVLGIRFTCSPVAAAGATYFVPSDSLDSETASRLGIASEADLYGGVVPLPFMATKVIAHPVVDRDANIPHGWCYKFGDAVQQTVLFGFSAFSLNDARRATDQLFQRGPVRVKIPRAKGGSGQTAVSNRDELERLLMRIDPTQIAREGIVLEENLSDLKTYSVGQIRAPNLLLSYFGIQHLTKDNRGASTYGGSDLIVVRGDFDALNCLDLNADARLAMTNGKSFDLAATKLLSGLIASRRNYDVIVGRDARGQVRCGVLEQSWRIGGATGAEVEALEYFKAFPERHVVHTRCVEHYGAIDRLPANAHVYFQGEDAEVGRLTKYSLVQQQ